MKIKTLIVPVLTACAVLAVAPAAATDAAGLFRAKCGLCHALEEAKMGPAIRQMSTDTAVLRAAITDGRKKMPRFGGRLSVEEIDALVAYIEAQR